MLPTSSPVLLPFTWLFLEIVSNVEFFPAKCVLPQLTIDVRIVLMSFYDVGEFLFIVCNSVLF